MAPSPVEEIVMLDLDRSNRGASKQRRDQINSEIGTMRDLLPLAESARQRLSQLQIMSLSCVYIRKCNILQKLFRSLRQGKDLPCDFFQALTGFILVTTREGKLLYISENVTDYLGHSMVDMKTQGDSLYDIVDKRDHVAVQTQLQGGDAINSQDIAFFCRMNMSRSLKRQAGFGDVKVMHVRGHFIAVPGSETGSEQQHVFMATCTPLITPELKENLVQNNTMIFKTVHQLDMSFIEITETAEHHLGYTNKEISGMSWYNALHPEDIHIAREKHVQLIRSSHEMGCMVTVRMLRSDGTTLWVNMVMHVRQAAVASTDEPVIVCINQVISEREAYQFKIQSNTFSIYPLRSGDMWNHAVGTIPPQHPTNQWIPNSSSYGQFPSICQSPPGLQEQLSQPAPYMRRGRSGPQNSAVSLQTEKVKQMLAKKLTGCKPAKIPRVSVVDHADKPAGYQNDFGLGSAPNSYFGTFETFSDTSLSFEPFWQAPTQVMPVSNYSVSSEPTMQKKGVMVEPPLLVNSTCLSPTNLLEQVVPDPGSMVPDSYLTPDPSPSCSPEHKSSSEHHFGHDSTFDLLEDLSKIEQVQQVKKMEEERSMEKAGMKRRRGELPLMDHMDIVSFFNDNIPATPSTPVVMKTKSKPDLPEIDPFDIEAFFGAVENQLSTTSPPPQHPHASIRRVIKQEPVESAPQMSCMTSPCYGSIFSTPSTMQPSHSPLQSVPSPHSPHQEAFSPVHSYTSEISGDELLDEINNSPIPMSLSVDVAEVKDEFEALQQAHFLATTTFEETELSQIQRLISSMVPESGSRNLLKDSQ